MRRNLWSPLVLVAAAAAAGTQAVTPAALQPSAFLLGEWVSEGAGTGGAQTGKARRALALQGTAMVRTSSAEYPGAGARRLAGSGEEGVRQ